MEFNKIANKLAELYRHKVQIERMITEFQFEIDDQILSISPADGASWIGKNAEDRSLTKERAFRDNAKLQDLRIDKYALEVQFDVITAEIEAVEAERRGAEWEVTAMLAEALTVKYRGRNPAPGVVLTGMIEETVYEAKELKLLLNGEIPF